MKDEIQQERIRAVQRFLNNEKAGINLRFTGSFESLAVQVGCAPHCG